MVQQAVLPPAPVPDMILLHHAELHFDLVVSRHSRLAVEGSVSHRTNSNIEQNPEHDENDSCITLWLA